MTNEKIKHFILLLAIYECAHKPKRKVVLDWIREKGYIDFITSDFIIKEGGEDSWRYDISYIRKHLVSEGFIAAGNNSYWSPTTKTWDYFLELASLASGLQFSMGLYITDLGISKARAIMDAQAVQDEVLKNQILEDDTDILNQREEIIIERIKRWQEIVKRLKVKYDCRCQICNNAFRQKNGQYYCEAHHLLPLSAGGSQLEDNVVILCANHHRMMHYAQITVYDKIGLKRKIDINGVVETIVYKP